MSKSGKKAAGKTKAAGKPAAGKTKAAGKPAARNTKAAGKPAAGKKKKAAAKPAAGKKKKAAAKPAAGTKKAAAKPAKKAAAKPAKKAAAKPAKEAAAKPAKKAAAKPAKEAAAKPAKKAAAKPAKKAAAKPAKEAAGKPAAGKPTEQQKQGSPPRGRGPAPASPRPGGQRVQVSNSGLEVWLYDEANLAEIRALASDDDPGIGGMPGEFVEATGRGLVVGYSLQSDGLVDVEVHRGAPFTEQELAVGRWLEPQTAWLRLPSGRLVVESNDASRLGPEEPGERGAAVEVPPGDYRLTLLRVDHEALDREGLNWTGPQELVLLSPGGTSADAAEDLLPFQLRRDLSWVGRYELSGSTAQALAWFDDYWDTFFVNLDGAACAALGLTPGRHFRTTVPQAGLTLVSVFGPSWEEARRLPPPANVDLSEYGYGAITRPQDWDQREALFCRREQAKTRAEDSVQTQWLPATVEVLDAAAHPPRAARSGLGPLVLREQEYFDDGFLTMVLSEVLPGSDDLDELPLAQALDRLDEELGGLGFTPQGDAGWSHDDGVNPLELGARLYTGPEQAFAAILASPGCFELLFLSETEAGWLVTGLVDELERRVRRGGPVQVQNKDEAVADLWEAHRARPGAARPAPRDLEQASAALARFLAATVAP